MLFRFLLFVRTESNVCVRVCAFCFVSLYLSLGVCTDDDDDEWAIKKKSKKWSFFCVSGLNTEFHISFIQFCMGNGVKKVYENASIL